MLEARDLSFILPILFRKSWWAWHIPATPNPYFRADRERRGICCPVKPARRRGVPGRLKLEMPFREVHVKRAIPSTQLLEVSLRYQSLYIPMSHVQLAVLGQRDRPVESPFC